MLSQSENSDFSPIQRIDLANEMEAISSELSDTIEEILPEEESSGQEIDLNELAKKVYELLKRETRLERERRGRTPHPW